MRRGLLAIGLMGLAACGSAKDLFRSRADVVAAAGGARLPAQRLADLMVAARGARLDSQTAEGIANVWLDYALVAQAFAQGDSLTDSATVLAVHWPEVAELRTNRWHEMLLARNVSVSAATTDSAYGGDDVRLVQHILIGLPQAGDTAAARAQARRQAQGVRARVTGANFGAIATQVSQDPGSARDQGYLPPSPRGAFVPTFDSTAWALAPGQVSGLVDSPFGVHIIRRPPLEEVRDRFGVWARQRATQKFDSAYAAGLQEGNALTVRPDAAARIKAALADLHAAEGSRQVLATYKGGNLTVGEMVRWIRILPPQLSQQLRQADSAAVGQFVKLLTTNVLLLRQADSAGVALDSTEYLGLRQRYLPALDSLRADLDFKLDKSLSRGARDAAIQAKLDSLFDRLITGQQPLRPMPTALGQVLRERMPHDMRQAGLARALEIARAARGGDSTGAAAPPAPGPGAVQPAPGGPPVPTPQP